MDRFLLLTALLSSMAYSSDIGSKTRNGKTCAEFVSVGYKGYTASKMNLVLLQESPRRGRTADQGNFLSLGMRVSRQNRNAVTNAFPSLRNNPAAAMDLAKKGENADDLFMVSDYFPVNTMNLGDPVRRTRANCLVAALAWFGLTDNLDLFHEDFSELLKENFELLRPSEPVPPESLVTWCGMGSDTWAACHAAVYLGDNIVWHKVGVGAPVYTYLEKVMDKYGVNGCPNDKCVMRFFRLKR